MRHRKTAKKRKIYWNLRKDHTYQAVCKLLKVASDLIQFQRPVLQEDSEDKVKFMELKKGEVGYHDVFIHQLINTNIKGKFFTQDVAEVYKKVLHARLTWLFNTTAIRLKNVPTRKDEDIRKQIETVSDELKLMVIQNVFCPYTDYEKNRVFEMIMECTAE